MISIVRIAIFLAITYIAVSAFIYFYQARLVFYPDLPSRSLNSTPGSINLDYEDVNFETSDNMKLHGWFIKNSEASATILFFHGNAGNISHRLESIRIFNKLKLNVFIFDYRGYGQSEGETTEEGTYKDAEAAWNYLTKSRKINSNQIIIFGRSLGGSIAAWLASQHQPSSLIIESSFVSATAIAEKLYPLLPIKQLIRFKYNTIDYIKKLSCPILIIHSVDDEIIPFDHGLTIFKHAKEPKYFLEITGGHNNGFLISGGDYLNGLNKFIYAQE